MFSTTTTSAVRFLELLLHLLVMVLRDHKLHALYDKSSTKALAISRRLVQSAKRRARRPFYPEYFDKARPGASTSGSGPSRDRIVIRPPAGVEVPSFDFPHTLEKPDDLAEVTPAQIESIESELKGFPVDYVRLGLVSLAPKLMGLFKECRADPPGAMIPAEMNVLVNDHGLSCLPTHVLAVYSPPEALPPSPSERISQTFGHGRPIELYPVHAIILGAYCARLPQFPPSDPKAQMVREGTPSESPATAYRLPVVRLIVPKQATFLPLLRYLYDHDKEQLLASLLPIGQPPVQTEVEPSPYANIDPYQANVDRITRIRKLAAHCYEQWGQDLFTVMRFVQRVEGLYRNAIALAISDDGLWDTMNVAWEALMLVMRAVDKLSHEWAGRMTAGATAPSPSTSMAQ